MGSARTLIGLAFSVAIFIEFLFFIRWQFVRLESKFCECRSVSNISDVQVNELRWVASIHTTVVDEYSGATGRLLTPEVLWRSSTGQTDIYYEHKCTATLITNGYLLTSSSCNDPTIELKQYASLGGTDRSLTYLYLSEVNTRMIAEYLVPTGKQTPEPIPEQGGKDKVPKQVAIARLEKPFVLGSQTNIYLACLFESSVKKFSGSLLVASYGAGANVEGDTKQRFVVGNISHVFTGQTTLAMIKLKQVENCGINNYNATGEVCADVEKEATKSSDMGSGLLYEYEPGRLYVVGVSISASPGRMAVFQTLYPHLKWINSVVDRNRCMGDRSFKFSTTKLACFLVAVLFTVVAALAVLFYIDNEASRKILGLSASKSKQNITEPIEANRTKSNEANPTGVKSTEPKDAQ